MRRANVQHIWGQPRALRSSGSNVYFIWSGLRRFTNSTQKGRPHTPILTSSACKCPHTHALLPAENTLALSRPRCHLPAGSREATTGTAILCPVPASTCHPAHLYKPLTRHAPPKGPPPVFPSTKTSPLKSCLRALRSRPLQPFHPWPLSMSKAVCTTRSPNTNVCLRPSLGAQLLALRHFLHVASNFSLL